VIGRTLFRYVLGDMLKALLVAVAWLMMVGLLAVLVRARFSNVGRLLGLIDCLAMLPWIVPYLFSIVLPPAVLAASCSTFGRLAAENELVAIRAAGISWRGVAGAPAVLGAVASLSLLWLNLEGFRFSAAALASQERSSHMDVDRLCRPGSPLELDSGDSHLTFTFSPPGDGAARPVSVISAGRRPEDGFLLSARDFDCEVQSVERQRNQPQRFVTFIMRDVNVVTKPFNPWDKEEFAEYRLPAIELPGGMSRGLLGGTNMRLSLDQNLTMAREFREEMDSRAAQWPERVARARSLLLAAGARAGGTEEALATLRALDFERRVTSDMAMKVHDLQAEASRKLAFSLSPLIFALLGIGMGAAARKASKLVSLTLGVVAAAAYYGAWVGSRAFVDYGFVSGELAPWIPNVLGLIGALVVVHRQNRS
jgi:lipopolysaccharide export LptBFGC system permease protein LptF